MREGRVKPALYSTPASLITIVGRSSILTLVRENELPGMEKYNVI